MSWSRPPTYLVPDVLPLIFIYVDSAADLASLCLANKNMRYYATPYLYEGSLFPLRCQLVAKYVRLLKLIGDREDIAAHVRSFIVPNIPIPHERYDDIWERAFLNCPAITSFEWKHRSSIPTAILERLHMRTNLRGLSLEGPKCVTGPTSANVIFSIQGLQHVEISLLHGSIMMPMSNWISKLSSTLVSLVLKRSDNLTDDMIETMTELPFPSLKKLFIEWCPEVGSYGLSRILQCAPDIEDLCIEHCNDIYLIELMMSYPCPELTRLRRLAINWEPGSDFWPYLTTFISASPLEHLSIDGGKHRQSTAFIKSTTFNKPFLRDFLQFHGARLRTFRSVGFDFDDAMLDQICSSCQQLVELNLRWYSEYSPIPKMEALAKSRSLCSFTLGTDEYSVVRGPSYAKGIGLVKRKTSVLD